MIFASDSQIRGVYLKSEVYFSVAKNLPQVTAVSHNGNQVYWTNINKGEESIFRSNEDGSQREVIVNEGKATFLYPMDFSTSISY